MTKTTQVGDHSESNRMIAEFMGAQFSAVDHYGNGQIVNYAHFEPSNHPDFMIKESGRKFDVNNLIYHQSWDWLMPVVEKIESLGFQVWFQTTTNMEFTQVTIWNTNKIIVKAQDYKIIACYACVIDFIKWYTSQPIKA